MKALHIHLKRVGIVKGLPSRRDESGELLEGSRCLVIVLNHRDEFTSAVVVRGDTLVLVVVVAMSLSATV